MDVGLCECVCVCVLGCILFEDGGHLCASERHSIRNSAVRRVFPALFPKTGGHAPKPKPVKAVRRGPRATGTLLGANERTPRDLITQLMTESIKSAPPSNTADFNKLAGA